MRLEHELVKSENYRVVYEWETVTLLKNDGSFSVKIGDFYGDPECGIIDENEKWCAIAGCGIIIYRLEEPFLEYEYNKKTNQWVEFGREANDIWWITNIHQHDENHVEITVDGEPAKSYILNVETLQIELLC